MGTLIVKVWWEAGAGVPQVLEGNGRLATLSAFVSCLHTLSHSACHYVGALPPDIMVHTHVPLKENSACKSNQINCAMQVLCVY